MVDARDRSGRKLMIGLNNRFTPWAQFAKDYVADGKLGDIYHAKCGWKRRRGIPGKGGWFTTKAQSGGGPLIDLGVHFIDVCNYLLGFPEPRGVSGRTYAKFATFGGPSSISSKKFADPEHAGTYDVEDLAVGFVRYEGELSLEVEFSWASNIGAEYNYVELYGTKGGLRYEKGQLTLFEEYGGTVIDATPKLQSGGPWGYDETVHFLDCIRNHKDVLSKPEEAVKVMKIIQGLYASAEADTEIVL
jgi:predicted dehydrogenase